MNEYIARLYDWISGVDQNFGQVLTVEDFETKLQDEDYASRMYSWISKKDPNFQKELSLDFFVEKVKKKDSFSQEPFITTEMEDAGLLEENQETEEVTEDGDSVEIESESEEEESDIPSLGQPLQPTEQDNVFGDQETFSIDGQEVDKETFDEYSKLQEQQTIQDSDPFTDALANINSNVSEETLVPQLNYNFREYGFEFEESGFGRDEINITSSDINPLTGEPYSMRIAVDTGGLTSDLVDKQIRDFLTKHKKENKKLNELEERLAVRQTKFKNQQQIDNSIKILNIEADAFNLKIQDYAKRRAEFMKKKAFVESLTQAELNTELGIKLSNEKNQLEKQLAQEKKDLLAQDVVLNNKGMEIDRLAGLYTDMKAQQGGFLGMTARGLFKGVGRETAFITDVIADVLVSDFSPLDLISDEVKFGASRNTYEMAFFRRALDQGYVQQNGKTKRFGDEIEPYESFEVFKRTLNQGQIDAIDDYIKDILRKDVKYGNVTIDDTTGEVKYDRPAGASRYSDAALKSELEKITSDGIVPIARAGLDIVLSDEMGVETTDEYLDLTREGFWGGAWLGLSESLPAMLGAGKFGWVQRTAQMFAQVSDHLNEEMMNDPDFAQISENEKRMVSLPIGITVGILEAYGFRNVINQRGLLNRYVLKGLQKMRLNKAVPAGATKGLTFRQVVQNEINNDIAKGVLIVGAGGLAEFETGFAQEIADISGKVIYNEFVRGKEMFNTPESFADGVRQVLRAGAQEMVGGWVMSSIPATTIALSGKDYTALSDPYFKTFELISQDPTIYKLHVQDIKNQINRGEITKEQGQQSLRTLGDLRSIVTKVPTDLTTEQRKIAAALLLNKRRLNRQRENIAPELRGKIDEEISQVDQLLNALLSGAKSIKGTEGRIEEEEINDEAATNYIKQLNESRAGFGLPPLQVTEELIQETKVQLKKQKDAGKKQSPVPKTGEIESQTTEEVAEGVSNELQQPTREGEQTTQDQAPPQKKTEVEQEVGDIQEFEGETPTGDVVVQEGVELETENITKDGKVQRTKTNAEVDTKVFEPVVRFAKRAGRAISRILPNVNIILHESSENFNKATNKTGRGYYDPTNQNIHIDLTKGNNKTVAHEVFHALLLNSVKTNAQARALTKRMVAAVGKAKGLTKAQKQKIDNFISNYDADIQNEEKLAEILGVLSDGYTKLTAPAKSRVRKWIESIAKKLGIDIAQFTKTDQDVIDLLNTVAGKIREGKPIAQKDVKTLKPKKPAKKEPTKKEPAKKKPVKEKQKKVEKKKEGEQFEGREQKSQSQQARTLAERYMMSTKGFISSRALYDTGRLRRELEALGLRLGVAKDEFTGQITGYYFQKVSKNGRPYYFNPFGRQQKDIDQSAGNIKEIANIVVRLRDNNFSPEAIQEYLINKKKFKPAEVKAVLGVSNFVLNRIPPSFSELKGGLLAGLKLFSKINKFRDGLLNNNLTPYGKKITALQQELEAVKSKIGNKKNKAAIQSIENKIENLKQKNQGAKIYKFAQSEITDQVIEYMKKQPAYISAKVKKGYSLQQAKMEMQIAKSFYATPSSNMANQIRLAKAIVEMNTREVSDINRLKSSLRNYIRAVLPPVEYDKPQVLDLIKQVQSATPKNIKDVKQKVMNLATTKVVQSLETKIDRQLGKNFAKTEGGRVKANIVDASTIKLLNKIKKEVAKIKKSKNAKALATYMDGLQVQLNDLQSKTNQGENNLADQAALEIILQYADANLMENNDIGKVALLNQVLNNLNETINEGRSLLEQQKRESYHTYLKDFEIAWESLTGNKIEMLIINPEFDPQLPISKSNEQLIVNPKANELINEFSELTDAKKNKAKSWPARTLKQIRIKLLNNVIVKRLDLPNLIEYMTKIPGKMFEGKFAEITTEQIDNASNQYKYFTMQDKADLVANLQRIYGKKWEKIVKQESLVRDTGIAKNLKEYNAAKKKFDANPTEENKAKLDIQTLNLSPLEMAYLVYQYKDPANKAGFETKYGAEFERIMFQMEEYLEKKNPGALALGDWMMNEAYPALYSRYNNTYKSIYRVDMPWNQYYIGPIRRENQEVQDIDLLATSGASSFQNTAAPASTKIRMQNKKAIATSNLLESFVGYQDKMNWFAAYAEPVNRLNKLFKNPQIEKIIKLNYPEGTYNMIMNKDSGLLTKIANKGLKNVKGMDAFFNQATSLFVVGRLGVNPTIYLKQLVSFPTYINEIGAINWTKYATLNLPQLRSTAKEIMDNSIYLQDRYSRSIIKSLENYKGTKASEFELGKSSLFVSPFQKVLNAQMYLIKKGDKGAIMIGGMPVYLYHKAQFKKQNPTASNQEAIDYAIKKFEKATRTTQQSTDLQNRDYYQDGGIIARTFNMFKTSIIQYLRKEIIYTTNMYRIMRGTEGRGGAQGRAKGLKNFYSSLKGFLVYHTVLPMLFQYLSAGLPGVLAPWDEEDGEDLTRAAIIGNFNALFVIGDFIKMMSDVAAGKPWGTEITSIPLLDLFETIADKYKKYVTTEDEEKKKQILFELFTQDLPGASGINAKSMQQWYKNITSIIEDSSDPREALLRLFNFSDYVIQSAEDRKQSKKRKKKISDRTLKKLYPELYKKRKELRDKAMPPSLKEQKKKLMQEKKRMREELLEKMRK